MARTFCIYIYREISIIIHHLLESHLIKIITKVNYHLSKARQVSNFIIAKETTIKKLFRMVGFKNYLSSIDLTIEFLGKSRLNIWDTKSSNLYLCLVLSSYYFSLKSTRLFSKRLWWRRILEILAQWRAFTWTNKT